MRRLGLLTLTASAVVLAVVPVWWVASRPDTSAGSLSGLELIDPVAVVPTPSATPRRANRSEAEPLAEAHRPKPRVVVPVRSARVEDLRGKVGPVPVSVRIPDLEIDASVVPVGVERETGDMELPPDNATVAWYRHGASPGLEGSAVLAGHVDYGEGRAVFFRLAELEPGARILIRYRGGALKAFRVVARRLVGKDELPPRIFSTRGRPLLTLVTCGGDYDAEDRSYLGNTLVFAVPLDAEPGSGSAQ